jgi:hypothetical protein
LVQKSWYRSSCSICTTFSFANCPLNEVKSVCKITKSKHWILSIVIWISKTT